MTSKDPKFVTRELHATTEEIAPWVNVAGLQGILLPSPHAYSFPPGFGQACPVAPWVCGSIEVMGLLCVPVGLVIWWILREWRARHGPPPLTVPPADGGLTMR